MKLEPRSSIIACLTTLFAATTAAQGKVWVVDDGGGPGVAFTTLQAAVDAAAEGDTLLVKDGSYDESVTISGKSLAVIAEVGASVQLQRTLWVNGLASNQWSLLRGLDVPMTSPVAFGDAMRVGSGSGPIWIEECAADGDFTFGGPASGVLTSFTDGVAIARCQFRGGSGLGSKLGDVKAGGTALSVVQATTYVYESTLQGEHGTTSGIPFGIPAYGGNGAQVNEGTLFASGCDLIGGNGSDGQTSAFGCSPGGNGGHGIVAINASSHLLLHDVTLQGGAGGLPAGACGAGLPGQPSVLFGGTLTTLPGASRSIEVGSPVREGQPVGAIATGQPGELVFLGVASSQSPGILVTAWSGAVHLGPGFSVLFAGVVPASGALAIGATAGQLAPGVESAVIYLQAGFAAPATGSIALGAPSALVVLDSAF